jgi:hypothetical protein
MLAKSSSQDRALKLCVLKKNWTLIVHATVLYRRDHDRLHPLGAQRGAVV